MEAHSLEETQGAHRVVPKLVEGGDVVRGAFSGVGGTVEKNMFNGVFR